MSKTKKIKTIDDRLEALEKFRNKVLPVIEAVQKFLDISKERVNPADFCKDDTDRRIVDYLIEHKAGATSEIAEALGLENPKNVGRHTIGKRINRLKEVSERNNWHILEFHPENKDGKFRAWWLNIDEINVEEFKKSIGS